MEPVIVECSSACTVTLQLEQTGPFVLSVADAAVLSMAIIGVWVVGASFRWLIRVVQSNQDA